MLVSISVILSLIFNLAQVPSVKAKWPSEIPDIPANDFYDCLYIYYICTDAVANWQTSKICTKLFQECELKVEAIQENPSIGSIGDLPTTSTFAPAASSTTTEANNDVSSSTAVPSTTQAPTTTAPASSTTTETTTTAAAATTEPPTTPSTTTSTTTTTTTTTTTATTTTTEIDSIEIDGEAGTTEAPSNESSSTLAQIPFKVTSCLDLRQEGISRSGIYDIQFGDETRKVFCDMSTLGGGWTVIQRRGPFDNPPDFFLRNWTEYRNGFGRPDKELWLGLEYMFLLTNVETVQLLINLEDFDNNRTAILVNEFRIANEDSGYRIFYKNFSSPLGKSLPAKGTKFSTIDRDNDAWSKNCAERFSGAWWYSACHNSNLNGMYLRGEHESFGDGVNWYHWKGYHYSLKLTVLKIRGVRQKK